METKNNTLGELNNLNSTKEKKIRITKITLKSGKTYALYSDGNLYEEIPGQDPKLVDKLNDENKEIIEKFVSAYQGPKTDMVEDERINSENKDGKHETER